MTVTSKAVDIQAVTSITVNGTAVPVSTGVAAITVSGGSGGTMTVDSSLSSSSTNPVQNKAIYSAVSAKQDPTKLHTIASGGASLDYSNGDYQKITLSSSLAISAVSNITSGQGMILEVDNASGCALTVGGSQILTSSDVGTYVVGFIHDGASVKIFKDAPEIYSLS